MVLYFLGECVKITHGTVYYGCGYIMYCFMVLNINYCNSNRGVYFSLFVEYSNDNLDVQFWHAKLGHIEQNRMNRLARNGLLGLSIKFELPTCEFYLLGKAIKKSFGKGRRAEFPLQIIHYDICGLMSVKAMHEAYFSLHS